MQTSTNPNSKSSSTLKTLQILDLISETPGPLTVDAIASTLDAPKNSVQRLCRMLEDEGFLTTRLDRKGFLPGPRLSKLAKDLFGMNHHWRSERQRILKKLSSHLGETCNVCVPEGTGMVYFDRVETLWPLRITFNINDRVPLYCTSTGKLYLSSLPESVCDRLLQKITLLPQTHNTITSEEDLKLELIKIRKEGVSIDNQEFMHGMVCIAVPVESLTGQFIAGLAMHAPASRMSLEQLPEVLPLLRSAAVELAQSISS